MPRSEDPLEFPPKAAPAPTEAAEVEPYGFAPDFERIIAAAACTRPRFWPQLAGSFSVEGVRLDAVGMALQAVAMIVRERGEGPSSVTTVIQRLRSWQEDGKITKKDVQGVRQMLMEAFDGPAIPPDAEILGEVVPILRRRLQQKALDEGYRALVGKGDLAPVEEMLERARRLGAAPATVGQLVNVSGFEAIRYMSALKRLPTGVAELDDELKGGMREGEYWLLAGGFGSGKSMALNQFFGAALTHGINAAFATVGELSVQLQFTRLVANLVNIPIDDLLDDMMREGEARLDTLTEKGLVAAGTIRYFPADHTSVGDLKAWVLAEEARIGAPIEALFVDYADKLGSKDPKQKKDVADKEVAEGLRGLMSREEHPDLHLRWVVSATQIARSAHDRKKTKKVEGHHAADSIAKPRICDGMWTLNPRDDGESILWHLTKNRTGKAGADVGPLPVDFATGRIAAPDRPEWPFG